MRESRDNPDECLPRIGWYGEGDATAADNSTHVNLGNRHDQAQPIFRFKLEHRLGRVGCSNQSARMYVAFRDHASDWRRYLQVSLDILLRFDCRARGCDGRLGGVDARLFYIDLLLRLDQLIPGDYA